MATEQQKEAADKESERSGSQSSDHLISEELKRRALRSQQDKIQESEGRVETSSMPSQTEKKVSPNEITQVRRPKPYGRARHHHVDIDSLTQRHPHEESASSTHQQQERNIQEIQQVAKDLAQVLKDHDHCQGQQQQHMHRPQL